jgi:outer membrane biosynthesis protein TonB
MTAAKESLIAQIDEAGQRVGGLERELQTIDSELAAFAAQRERYRLLEDVCASLETLERLGAAPTFWGEKFDQPSAAEHVRAVRGRVAEYAEQVRIAEDKRRSIVEGIAQGGEVLAILEGDLLDIEDEEIERSLEWVVERELGPVPDGPPPLWVRGGEEDVRLRKSLAASLLALGLAALLLPLIHPPATDVEQAAVPERIVKFIELDQHRPAPPPPPVEQPKQKEKEPEPLVAEHRPAETKPAPKPAEEPKPVEPPRQRAEKAGILAFRDSFATIAERKPAAKLGAQARVGNTGEPNSGPQQRALITSLATGGSGGINVASFSRDVGGDGGGGGALDGVDVGRVADSIGGGPGEHGAAGRRAGDGALAGRTDEEIQIVFDRYKASLYRLYNRELRNDPTLRGQVVLRLTIEPDGSVSLCQLQSTDMNAPALTQQVVDRVKTFAFGAKDVPPVTIVYPIDFLPAA